MALPTLKKRSAFLEISKNGRKWVSRGFIIQVMPNNTGTIRVGFTVSKKVDKRAVVRNRIKRRLRALVNDILPQCVPVRGESGFDFVLIGRAETATRPYDDLEKDMKWCLAKLGISSLEKSRRSLS